MRPTIPGDIDPFLGTRDEIPAVAIKGTITSVDSRRGVVTVRLGAAIGARHDVKIPLFQFSLNRTKSSWFRFMPQPGDGVTLIQGLDGDVHIVNYECLNYAQLAGANDADRLLFRELNEGEFEIRSAGLATVFGSDKGELRLAGGPCTITLDRQGLETVHDSALHKMLAVGCELRFGEVRRKTLPTDLEETATAGGVQREFRIVVARSTGVADVKLVDATLGDVVADTAPYAPALSSGIVPAPVRVQVRVFDDLGETELFRFQTDNLGFANLQARNILVQPSTTLRIGSNQAVENAVLGQTLKNLLSQLIDQIQQLVIATGVGPASPNPSSIAALEALRASFISNDAILSDFVFLQKLATPGEAR